METAEIALTIYLTLLTTGMSALFWARMNRLEERMDRIEERMATKEEMAAFRDEMLGFRAETSGRFDDVYGRFDEVRAEMNGGFGGLRAELAIMRSDLTHVALAVGAKPRASGD